MQTSETAPVHQARARPCRGPFHVKHGRPLVGGVPLRDRRPQMDSEERSLRGDPDSAWVPVRAGGRLARHHECRGTGPPRDDLQPDLGESTRRPPLGRAAAGGFADHQQASHRQKRGCALRYDRGGPKLRLTTTSAEVRMVASRPASSARAAHTVTLGANPSCSTAASRNAARVRDPSNNTNSRSGHANTANTRPGTPPPLPRSMHRPADSGTHAANARACSRCSSMSPGPRNPRSRPAASTSARAAAPDSVIDAGRSSSFRGRPGSASTHDVPGDRSGRDHRPPLRLRPERS